MAFCFGTESTLQYFLMVFGVWMNDNRIYIICFLPHCESKKRRKKHEEQGTQQRKRALSWTWSLSCIQFVARSHRPCFSFSLPFFFSLAFPFSTLDLLLGEAGIFFSFFLIHGVFLGVMGMQERSGLRSNRNCYAMTADSWICDTGEVVSWMASIANCVTAVAVLYIAEAWRCLVGHSNRGRKRLFELLGLFCSYVSS